MQKQIFIGIGANLGSPLAQCQRALTLLSGHPQLHLVRTSSFYESEPLVPGGVSPKTVPCYVNAVCEMTTELSPAKVLEILIQIEKEMGRERRAKWESRIIDLDFLAYENVVLNSSQLTLPHPEMAHRSFVLVPLCEIAPQWMHPVLKKTVGEMVQLMGQNQKITPLMLLTR
ncbi:MAG TPA: 2-amino-4-hydroxy-6-hydroxymethyldihydropteridine diphosphokinase [Deltaproteobacteria bacterium]|nr:MAG: 2-amino-4-hydroxy-6-hydroxymethyldihydropteridine diphosphokinase [Deltaproteobacteria bacterium GWA2_45_12]HBF12778.1 2-amino-4-hydroxy-6-hydroxymethyldihydropteridine diphosphokinase [Deltaproteobacteria bacterium]